MNIYLNLYNLINTYIFGGTVVSGDYTELVCILVATLGALFIIAVPFALVIKFILRWI